MARKLIRRSFLARVIGGAAFLATGAGAGANRRSPRRGLCSDADSGANADPRNAWYGDRDSGANADPLRSPPQLIDRDVNSDPRTEHQIGRCGEKPRPEGR